MGDERLRALERAAAQGDPDAAEALSRIRVRHVQGAEFPQLRELEERGVDLQAPARLPLDQERLLAEDLEPLGERAGDALAFVLQGHAPEVLDRISPADREALVLRPQAYYPSRPYDHEFIDRRLDLLEVLKSPPALVRLGLIYSAGSGPMFSADHPGGPEWLYQLILAARHRPQAGPAVLWRRTLDCETLLGVVDYALLDSEPLLQLFFGEASGGDWRFASAGVEPRGVVELAERHPDYLRRRLSERHWNGRAYSGARMIELGIPIDPYYPELARLAGQTRGSSSLAIRRELGERYAAGLHRPEIRRALEDALRSGTPDERRALAGYVGEVCGQASRAALERAAARDRAPRVRRAAQRALEELTLVSGDPDLELDPLAPPGPEAEAAFREAFRDHAELERAWALLCEPTPWAPLPEPPLSAELSEAPLSELLDAFAQLPKVQLGHVCRAVRLTGRLEAWGEDWRLRDQLRALDALARVWFETHGHTPSLGALGEAWGFLGLDERILGKVALTGDVIDRYFSAANAWSCADFYRRNPQTLTDGLRNVTSGINEWRTSLLEELAAIVSQLQAQPEGFPEEARAAFLELALASAKSTRARGQALLAPEGDWVDEGLVKELGARRAGKACAAARWLGQRALVGHGGRRAAAEAGLEARLREEKREKVCAAIEEVLASLADADPAEG